MAENQSFTASLGQLAEGRGGELMERLKEQMQAPQNISRVERLGSAAVGSLLLMSALGRGRSGGLFGALFGGALLYRGVTGHCHGYDILGLNTAEHPDATSVPAQQGVKVEQAITINRPAEELYAFWRDFQNLPKVMRHLKRVDMLENGRSRWVAQDPFGRSIEWEAEIINDRQPDMLAWRSLPGSEVDTAGSVHFKSLGHERGTVVSVSLKYNPPGGKLGATVAWLFGSAAEQQVQEDLRSFKSQMEAGEIPTTQGQPRGL